MSFLKSLLPSGRGSKTAAQAWHRWIQSTARDPDPYRAGWVEDTLDGRFQMVALVSTLVLRRLRDIDDGGPRLADKVYRVVFDGFDHALREEGVGDASIARRMRGLGEHFFGLARRIDSALELSDPREGLEAALTENGICAAGDAASLVTWFRTVESRLDQMDDTTLLKGPPETQD